MRRNKIYAIAAVAALLAGNVAYKTYTQAEMSDVLLANIEALADGETSSNYNICYNESKVVAGRTYYDCGTCSKVYDECGKGKATKCFYK